MEIAFGNGHGLQAPTEDLCLRWFILGRNAENNIPGVLKKLIIANFSNQLTLYDAGTCACCGYSGKGYGWAPAYKSLPHGVRLIVTLEVLSPPVVSPVRRSFHRVGRTDPQRPTALRAGLFL